MRGIILLFKSSLCQSDGFIHFDVHLCQISIYEVPAKNSSSNVMSYWLVVDFEGHLYRLLPIGVNQKLVEKGKMNGNYIIK